MEYKKPMRKESVGSQYYAFNKSDVNGNFDPSQYEDTIKTDTVKQIGTTENGESQPIYSSGQVYDTVSETSYIDLAVEVVAFDVNDLARMRGDEADSSGLMTSGKNVSRPFFAYGKVVKKTNNNFKYEWFPKCQLLENTDDISTKEESFSEQNDTVTIRCYAYDDLGNKKNYVDSEAKNFPAGLTEEKFFKKPIITKEDLVALTNPSTEEQTSTEENPGEQEKEGA